MSITFIHLVWYLYWICVLITWYLSMCVYVNKNHILFQNCSESELRQNTVRMNLIEIFYHINFSNIKLIGVLYMCRLQVCLHIIQTQCIVHMEYASSFKRLSELISVLWSLFFTNCTLLQGTRQTVILCSTTATVRNSVSWIYPPVKWHHGSMSIGKGSPQ